MEFIKVCLKYWWVALLVMALLIIIWVLIWKSGLFEKRATLDEKYYLGDKYKRKLVGKSGKAITNLNLAGKAKICGKIYEVISQNSYIEKGSNIKVVKIDDNSIVVRKWFE